MAKKELLNIRISTKSKDAIRTISENLGLGYSELCRMALFYGVAELTKKAQYLTDSLGESPYDIMVMEIIAKKPDIVDEFFSDALSEISAADMVYYREHMEILEFSGE